MTLTAMRKLAWPAVPVPDGKFFGNRNEQNGILLTQTLSIEEVAPLYSRS